MYLSMKTSSFNGLGGFIGVTQPAALASDVLLLGVGFGFFGLDLD